jgi:prepilin-type N-terminal cleavage/methylation domain-containing protein
MFKNNFKKENTQKGFTLVEMMVAVAIFSIVVMISLGAILTVLDANRKARTLTEVMNNMNFSIEMITRSLKTGVEPDYEQLASNEEGENFFILSVGSIILDESGFQREKTRYRLMKDGERGYIARCTNFSDICSSDEWDPITSDLVDVDRFEAFVVGYGTENDGVQPRTQLFISGTVRVNENISSDFSLQTTVSQRRLNLQGSESDTQ